MQRDYQQRLGTKDPRGPTPEQWRDAQKKELEQTYREPALAHLKFLKQHPHDDKAQAPPPPQYVEALIAFHELPWSSRITLALVGAVAGAVAELVSTRFDDNFTIPLTVTVAASAAQLFLPGM